MLEAILNSINTLLAQDTRGDAQKTKLFTQSADPELRALAGKLDTRDILLLATIGVAEPLPQKMLTSCLPLSQPTASRTVTRLSKLGLLLKERIPANQKEWQLRLTPLGSEIAVLKQQFDAERQQQAALIASHYTDAELARFNELLQELIKMHGE
jgi:DNA-binding MarR family transcriptional regulator